MPYLHTRVPRIPRLLVGILVLTASALPALPALCQTPEPDAELRLKVGGRSFVPPAGVEPAFRQVLSDELQAGKVRHVLLQLDRHLSEAERMSLSERGVELLSYLGGYGWYATLSQPTALDFSRAEVVKRHPELGWLRWIGEIQPRDRLAPQLLDEDAKTKVRTEDGMERYTVQFFRDVSVEKARRLLDEVGAQIDEQDSSVRRFLVVVPPGALERLSREDAVMSIDFYPPPFAFDNDGARLWCGTDAVHLEGIDGAGVVLGMWDGGMPRNEHLDLTSERVHWEEDEPTVGNHPTVVCGVMVGTGTADPARMGHAPGVSDVRCYTAGGAADEMEAAVAEYGMVAANNSWGLKVGWAGSDFFSQSWFGDYRFGCEGFDKLTRDHGLVLVFAAGNDRNDSGGALTSDEQPADWDQISGDESWQGFHTVAPMGTAKNVIGVGAINDSTGTMSSFSNWGPTDDGRIKPDVVAPGVSIWTTSATLGPDDVYDQYTMTGGTSISAPAVTGLVALLVQSYREEYLASSETQETPLPSTIKALLCHSATDMGEPGPDYKFGWGGVRVDAARQILLDKRFQEGVVLATDDTDVYELTVGSGETDLRVTLAWDDKEATDTNPDPTLVNDLDLLVQDPGGRFFTPWHLFVTDHTEIDATAIRTVHDVDSPDLIPEADRDRRNNVEQVFVDTDLAGGTELEPGIWRVLVEADALPEAPQRYSLVSDLRLVGKVDVMQVLDRSGSMTGFTSDLSVDSKIDVLKTAASHFIEMMDPEAGKQLGLVQFNQDVVDFPAEFDTSLQELTVDQATHLLEAVDTITADGRTSIGDGLALADSELTAASLPDHDRVVLLVTDGKENEPDWIADIKPDLVDHEIAVYALGLGYGSGIDEAKLAELVDATGGDLWITDDDLVFKKLFLEVLASDVIVDPIGHLEPGETARQKATVSGTATGATFTAYWEGLDDAVELRLIPPGATEPIDLSTLGDHARGESRSRYTFVQLDFPLPIPWAGDWTMEVEGTDQIPADESVRYAVSAFSSGGIELDLRLDRRLVGTGDQVSLQARLTRGGRPVPGARVRMRCDVPTAGAGNVLHDAKLRPARLKLRRAGSRTNEPAATATTPDPVSPVDRKLARLNQHLGYNVLTRGEIELDLWDDGRHDDGEAEDGTYANVFDRTRIAGTTTCRAFADGIPVPGGTSTTREGSVSFHSQVAIDAAYSVVDLRLLTCGREGGCRYRVIVVPRDAFGNYLGPGYPVAVRGPAGSAIEAVPLTDELDGVYVGTIMLPKPSDQPGVRLEITVAGRYFATVAQPPLGRWSLSLHTGVASPRGRFAATHDTGRALTLDLGYRLKPRLSLVALLGHHDFPSAGPNQPDTYWTHLSANLRHGLIFGSGLGNPRFFLGGGVGYYSPKHGDDEWGGNLGLGVEYELTPQVTLSAGVDYHTIFDEDAEFVTGQVGVVVHF